MQTLLAVLFYVPGAAELFTFLIILTILTLLRKRASWDLIPRAILLTCAVFITLGVFSPNGPLYFVMLAVIALISLLGRKNLAFEKAVLPLTLLAYFACSLLFTFVDHRVVVPATWSLGTQGEPESARPPEQLVEFRFGYKNNQTFGVYSDELAQYLKTQAMDKVEISVHAIYDWGKLAGVSLGRINGKEFETSRAFNGCIDDCKDSPYPKIFLGLRSHF